MIPQVIQISREVITMIDCTSFIALKVSFLFNIIPRTFVPQGRSVQTPPRQNPGPLNSQPFANTRFHFLNTVLSATSTIRTPRVSDAYFVWIVLKDHRSFFSGCRVNTSDVGDTNITREWKWLFVNGCVCNRPISTAKEFLKLLPRWDQSISVLARLGPKIIVLKRNKWDTFKVIMNSRYMTCGILLTELRPYIWYTLCFGQAHAYND